MLASMTEGASIQLTWNRVNSQEKSENTTDSRVTWKVSLA